MTCSFSSCPQEAKEIYSWICIIKHFEILTAERGMRQKSGPFQTSAFSKVQKIRTGVLARHFCFQQSS